jgi:hypothetical protein
MSRPDFPQDNNVVAWLVLGYLCSHPDAKDTVDGVGRWWLSAKGIEADAETVRAALDYLVERRWLISTAGYLGYRLYGLNQERKIVLQQFLHSQSIIH